MEDETKNASTMDDDKGETCVKDGILERGSAVARE